VTNAAPTLTVGGDRTVNEGAVLSLTPIATFTDPGTLDTHTATINWGDGSTSAGTVTEAPFGPPGSTAGAGGSVAASHSYAAAGTYPVSVTATDADGLSDTKTFQVAVIAAPTASITGQPPASTRLVLTPDGQGLQIDGPPGTPATVSISYSPLSSSSYKNEFGFFVLDANGKINGKAPGQRGFLRAALRSRNNRIVFRRGQKVGITQK